MCERIYNVQTKQLKDTEMTTPMQNRGLKFRPVLTLSQMEYIVECLHDDQRELGKSVKRVLVPMLAKIEVGAITPAYKISEVHQIKMAKSELARRYESGEMSPDEESQYESELLGDM
jgi:hypothetical protein